MQLFSLPYRGHIVFILFLLFSAGLSAPLSSGEGPDDESGARRVRQILMKLENDHQSGRVRPTTYQLSEKEINAYLAEELRSGEDTAVQAISVVLMEGGFRTSVELDGDRLQPEDKTTALLSFLLGGPQTLKVDVSLQARNGTATYEVERASLNGLFLPTFLVAQFLTSLGQRQDPPFDPTEAFPLPYGIKSLTLRPGGLTIHT